MKRLGLFILCRHWWKPPEKHFDGRYRMQLELDFTPGLTQQYPEMIDCIAASVYGSRLKLLWLPRRCVRFGERQGK